MAASSHTIQYTGDGQSGVWNDPANWAGSLVPGPADTAVIGMNATLNGSVEVSNLMLLGVETDTINGAIKTDSTNVCESFMVCEGAVANFTAGASLHSAGGFDIGIDASGTVNIAAAANGKAAAAVNTVVMKVGQDDQGVGTVNVAGTLTASTEAYVGLDGQGVMNVTGSGQANLGDLKLGYQSGAAGTLAMSGTSAVNVAGWLTIGTSVSGAPGGTGTVTVGGSSTLYCDHSTFVYAGSSVTLAGGLLSQGPDGMGLQINQGGTVSGHGTISSAVHGVADNGTLEASGGTLLINGNINGMGVLRIGSGATLDLNSSKIGVASISFLGSNDTLGLTAGVAGVTLTGFAMGDEIVMSGVNGVSWNGSTDVLNLTENGHLVDQMTLSGVAANAAFHVTSGSSGSVISMMATQQTQGFVVSQHH
jgi:hypothetical protein